MKQGLYQPKALVNIKKIPELRGIKFDAAEGLIIGALVTHRELETSRAHKRETSRTLRGGKRSRQYPRAQYGNGRRQSRFRRTADGFIANFYCAGRQAKNYRAHPGSARSRSKSLFLDFYTTSLAEDEIITQVVLPPLPPNSGIEYTRFSSSSVVDKPSAGVAVRLTLDEETVRVARIVLGCVGPTPVRARKAEVIDHRKETYSGVDRGSRGNCIARVQSDAATCVARNDTSGRSCGTLVKRAMDAAYKKALLA